MQLDALGSALDAPRDERTRRRGDVLAALRQGAATRPVLEALEEAIAERRGAQTKATATEVFAAALAGVSGGGASAPLLGVAEACAAVASPDVVEARCAQICDALLAVLTSEDAAAARAAARCVGVVLGRQREAAWRRPDAKRALERLLDGCVRDARPKVRRAAAEAVRGVFQTSDHAAKHVLTRCRTALDATAAARRDGAPVAPAAFHLLGLAEVLAPVHSLAAACATAALAGGKPDKFFDARALLAAAALAGEDDEALGRVLETASPLRTWQAPSDDVIAAWAACAPALRDTSAAVRALAVVAQRVPDAAAAALARVVRRTAAGRDAAAAASLCDALGAALQTAPDQAVLAAAAAAFAADLQVLGPLGALALSVDRVPERSAGRRRACVAAVRALGVPAYAAAVPCTDARDFCATLAEAVKAGVVMTLAEFAALLATSDAFWALAPTVAAAANSEDRDWPAFAARCAAEVARGSHAACDALGRAPPAAAAAALAPLCAAAAASDDAALAAAARRALGAVAQITPPPAVSKLFRKLATRLLRAVQAADDRDAAGRLLQVGAALAPSLAGEDAATLWRCAAPLLDDPALQKRAYGCVQGLCEARPDSAWAVVLVGKDAPVACRARRIACVTALVRGNCVAPELVAALASEAALGTRDANNGARKAAFALLDALGEHYDARELVQMLSAALVAQTAHMRAAGLCALSRVVFVRASMLQQDLPFLLEAAVLLLADPATEVQTASLQFLRVATAALCADAAGKASLEASLPATLAALNALGNRGRHRAAVKALIRKWCRVFGHDAIEKVAPATDAPLLKALRRADAKKGKRKRAASDADTGGGDDADASSSGPDDDFDVGVAADGRVAVVRVDAVAAAARKARESAAAAAAAAPPRRRRKATSKAAKRGRRTGGDKNRADGVQPYAYDSLGVVARRGKRVRR